MILDWLAREFWMVLAWWTLVTLAGLAVLPLCWRLLSALPDKGYTLARTVGLLLVGFVFWLLASLGWLNNSAGSMIIAWILVALMSLLLYFKWRYQALNLTDYWRDNKAIIITSEAIFFLMLFAWAIFRAYQNDTFTTEKPMELAFISGIMRSDTFPPLDPWMAGYSISYYYFGYVMSAMLATLSNVNSGVAFSLTTALTFALSGLTAFGVVANMVRAHQQHTATTNRRPAIVTGILALTFVTLLGNFQLPLIEFPYQSRSMPAEYFEFWGTQARSSFNDTNPYQQLRDTYTIPAPEDMSYWWWFRASRVLTDYNLDNTVSGGAQPIDEFPQFSFLLADNHPHVLTLPFAIMMLGIALNLLLLGRPPSTIEIIFYGIAIGGLIFLNTWDGPIYLIALIGTEVLRRAYHQRRLTPADWFEVTFIGGVVLTIAIIAYIPFFIAFRSQASGILPNIIHPTLFRQYFIMFAPFLLLLTPFLIIQAYRAHRVGNLNLRLGVLMSGGFFFVLLLLMLALIVISAFVPNLYVVVQGFVQQHGGWSAVLPLILERRLAYALTTLILLLAIALIVARLFPRTAGNTSDAPYSPAVGFALLLLGIATTLTLVPEFIYLRDNFGMRINTIFKFYYQAWIAFSLASAFAVYYLLLNPQSRLNGVGQGAYALVLTVVLVLGLTYPIYGIYHRAMVETGRTSAPPEMHPVLTLDGTQRMIALDDYFALMCLSDHVGDRAHDVVVAEAVRDAYNPNYARVGTITGIPILLGWPNHQRQWRGATYDEIAGTREQDINRLYNELDWQPTLEIIRRYNIDYIVFGRTERMQYDPLGEEKFQARLQIICEVGDTRIYRVAPQVLTLP